MSCDFYHVIVSWPWTWTWRLFYSLSVNGSSYWLWVILTLWSLQLYLPLTLHGGSRCYSDGRLSVCLSVCLSTNKMTQVTQKLWVDFEKICGAGTDYMGQTRGLNFGKLGLRLWFGLAYLRLPEMTCCMVEVCIRRSALWLCRPTVRPCVAAYPECWIPLGVRRHSGGSRPKIAPKPIWRYGKTSVWSRGKSYNMYGVKALSGWSGSTNRSLVRSERQSSISCSV